MAETLSNTLTHLLNETLTLTAEAPSETRDSRESHRAALIHEASRAFRKCLDEIADEGRVEEVLANDAQSSESADERLWSLTKLATAFSVREEVPDGVNDAVAALQEAACILAQPGVDTTDRIDELRSVQRALKQRVQVRPNGPYIVTNVDTLTTWLGESCSSTPRMALCRCGASASKPFCDGTHARKPFDDTKDPKRVPDRQDTYIGQQVTILDNRGTCAHSGFCTDRLSRVFHLKEDPFITPSGARMDEIVRAVRNCPSGALSLAIDGREARDTVDTVRKPSIEVSKDGPYRVTGGIPLVDDKGAAVTRNAGASLEHYSLCRCGHSQNKPFCSGMHWSVRFQDPSSSPDHQPTLFEWAGGLPALTRMTRLFYSKHVPEDPLTGPLFAKMSPDHPERVAAWLGEVFGGPKVYSTHYGGYTRMVSQHLGKGLTEPQRARWVSLMIQSADEAGIPRDPEFRAACVAYLEWGSRLALENSQPGAHPPPNMPVPRWWWVCNATPGSRVSALQPAPERAADSAPTPKPDESVSFAVHVKPLFRSVDRKSMLFVFDLWAFTDVVTHAAEILRRLENGSMPCDGAWPKSQVNTFRRWIESGTSP
jgi:CDGSH-type Zn-finger protein/truncated hemoglobin YjbI